MAQQRSSVSRRGSKNGTDKDDDDTENNGYVQILVKPLEQGSCNLILHWLGGGTVNFTSQQVGALYGLGAIVGSVCLYQLLRCDLVLLFHRLSSLVVPTFTIVSAFYWLSLYFRKTWSTTSIYLLFSSCYLGETVSHFFVGNVPVDDSWDSDGSVIKPSILSHVSGVAQALDPSINYVLQPIVLFILLLSISFASLFSSLETAHSAVVIVWVSVCRFLACTTLTVLPSGLRPYVAYTCGFVGILVFKYMETVLRPPINNFMTQDGKIPVIKRRRSSSSSAHGFSHRSARRTSLPALIQKTQEPLSIRDRVDSESSAASYESAIIGEAHGLVTDMLADSSLPPHIVNGLRTVSNLLKPPENHSHIHKPKVSPLVSLTESSNYGSDSEDLPYTGERPSSLPKRLRRSLPPSLIRRMSTSTWTTTTSATGMPTLEPEPCRVRSSSFRHRENTPSSSPTGSRSNSPSPSSPTTVTLTIPKSRSFSVASPSTHNLPPSQKRLVRKSVGFAPLNTDLKTDTLQKLSPLVSREGVHAEDSSKTYLTSAKDAQTVKRLTVTSDYESNDSPSSSDHSDNVLTSEDLASSPPKKLICRNDINPVLNKPQLPSSPETVLDCTEKEVLSREDVSSPCLGQDSGQEGDGDDEGEEGGATPGEPDHPSKPPLPTYLDTNKTLSIIEDMPLLQIHRLQEWDYPIFDLADSAGDYVLSMVAYKLFLEVGLFETFRIPLPEFLHYFHALELGYRRKPYHNCVHATDVLHGVYFLTTQAIPGFQQTSTDTFGRHGSSSESECETDRSFLHRPNFLAEDSYGIMGGNFPALELMACYTAAAMHDYDHPGRTNAFLVATHAPQAILYNDRSVLENHHAAAAWNLFLSDPKHNFLSGLDQAEFKRFRFLVIENILATDLKRHFEILAEFNAKVNDDDAPGIDWTQENDRLLAMQMAIKLADINGPCKTRDLHVNWTMRISEEFYEQGDEEAKLGMVISPYMDRKNPQLCKLQESFINHLVAPLCNAMVTGGLVPGTWVDEESDGDASGTDTDKGDSSACKDTEDELTDQESNSPPVLLKKVKSTRKVNCLLTKNLKENHEYWVTRLKKEEGEKSGAVERENIECTDSDQSLSEEEMVPSIDKVTEMETIKEEVETVNGKTESPS